MNGTFPKLPDVFPAPAPPAQIVQVLSAAEIRERQQPELRLPRQANHYAQLVGHFLAVKNSRQIARAMDAHFKRLMRYHTLLLGQADPGGGDRDD